MATAVVASEAGKDNVVGLGVDAVEGLHALVCIVDSVQMLQCSASAPAREARTEGQLTFDQVDSEGCGLRQEGHHPAIVF